jgi:hypothetical protein
VPIIICGPEKQLRPIRAWDCTTNPDGGVSSKPREFTVDRNIGRRHHQPVAMFQNSVIPSNSHDQSPPIDPHPIVAHGSTQTTGWIIPPARSFPDPIEVDRQNRKTRCP